MIEIKEKDKTMRKLKLYGKKEGFEGFIATIYVKDGKLVIESEFPEVKEEMEELITKAMGDEGLPMGRGAATIEVTEDGKLTIEAMDLETERGLRKEIKVFRKSPNGPYVVDYRGKELEVPVEIKITYIRPGRFPNEPQFFDGLIHSEPLYYEIDPKMPVTKGGFLNRLGPRKFAGYEVDEYKCRLIEEKD